MIKEFIIGNLVNYFQNYIGKYIFPKTKIRWKYKDKLIEISDYFNEAMDTWGKSCSLSAVLKSAKKTDMTETIKIQCQEEKAVILEKWYASLNSKLNIANPKDINKYSEEFSQILYQAHAIFRDFSQVIRGNPKLIEKLKMNDAGYSNFEKIYDRTTSEIEKLSKEASKKLKGEFKDYHFNPLPKL
ncbi:unnamed protein product [marine sediment metagenome]|uniref:Uncharacterized protein n=1 Tax=marine sediment metagenome TaxID=412755 RepID=X1BDP3_9ZZZZ